MVRHKHSISGLLLLITLVVVGNVYVSLLSGRSWRPSGIGGNPAYVEGLRFADGHLHLESRIWDTAILDGKAYNVFQPGQTFFYLIHHWLGADGFNYLKLEFVVLALLSAAMLGIGFWKLSDGNILLPSLLVLAMFLGAPYFPSFKVGLEGSVYRLNHVFSVFFISMVILAVSFGIGRRTLLVAGIAIGFAALFRAQNILLLCLPALLYFANGKGDGFDYAKVSDATRRRGTFADAGFLLAAPAVALFIILLLQYLKFGSPLNSGYGYLYEGREDFLAIRAREHALVSLYYLPENVFRTLWATPELNWSGWKIVQVRGNPNGNSLIFTQPVLLLGLMFFIEAIRSARFQAFFISAIILAMPVLLYHNPGYLAAGYMRLALDYLPLWIAVIAVGVRLSAHQVFLTLAAVVLCYWSLHFAAFL